MMAAECAARMARVTMWRYWAAWTDWPSYVAHGGTRDRIRLRRCSAGHCTAGGGERGHWGPRRVALCGGQLID